MRTHPVRSLVFLLPTLLLAVSAGAAGQTEIVLEDSLAVSPGGTLRVDVPDADLRLEPGSSATVEVVVRLRSRNLDRARERFDTMNFRAASDGSTATIEADRVRGSWRDWSMNGGFSVELEIRHPEELNLDLQTGDGDIAVRAVRGSLEVQTGDGDISLGRVDGDEASIRTGDGDVRVDELRAGSLVLTTSDGDVGLGPVEAATIRVSSGDGDIRIESARGELTVSTGDGDISVGLGAGSGRTSIESGDGDISIRVAEGAGFSVDLHGEEVRVTDRDAFSGRRDERSAEGALNGGGPELRARTSDGEVVLRIRAD